MASAIEEFNFLQTVLYLWTVYTYSLFMCSHVYMFCFTAPKESVLRRVIPIFILKITLNLFCCLYYNFSLILLKMLYLDIQAFCSGLKNNRWPNATSEVLPTLRRTSRLRNVGIRDRQKIAVIIAFRKCNQKSLKRRPSANTSYKKDTLYFQVH